MEVFLSRRKGVSRAVVVVVIIVVVVVAGLVAFYATTSTAPTQSATLSSSTTSSALIARSYYFAYIGPFSGPAAAFGNSYRNGFIWAVDYINSHGGIDGAQITYTVSDDKGDPATAASLALSAADSGAIAVFGGYGSTVLAIQNVANQNKFVFINTGDPAITTISAANNLNGYGFYTTINSIGEGNISAHFASLLGVKTAALVGTTSLGALGTSTYNYTKAFLQQLGIKIVYETSTPSGTTDYSGVITALKSVNPDAVFMIQSAPDVVTFVKQSASLGYGPKAFICQFGCSTPTFITDLGKLANGIASWQVWLPDFPTSFSANFTKLFQSQFGYVPGYREAYEADDVFFVAEAIHQLHVAGIPVNSANLKNEIHTYYSTERIGTHWFDFLLGPVKLNDYGYSTVGTGVEYQVQNGTWVSVYSPNPAVESKITALGHKPVYPMVPWPSR